MIDLPALPRLARVAMPAAGAAAALFVAHDDGISVIARGPEGWTRSELAAPRFARDVAVGDLDGDGHADLLVADGAATDSACCAAAMATPPLNNSPRCAHPRRLLLADIDGDGRPDVLVIGDDGLAVHPVHAGVLGPARVLDSGDHLADVAAADVNGDARIDLAVLDRSRSTLPSCSARRSG